MHRSPLVLLVAAAFACPHVAAAQHDRWASTSWVDDLNFASVNAVIGGLTAGIASELRGGSFREAFAGGALGGGVVYVGKRMAAARFDGAGLLGRQVGAVGASITRNASTSSGLLDSLVVPVGPVRATVSPTSWSRPTLRLDARDAYWLLYALAEDRLSFDAGRSLSAGTPVFTTDALLGRDDPAIGWFVGGTIILARRARDHLNATFAHERVHAVQYDALKHSIGYPLEDWLRDRAGVGNRGPLRHVLAGMAHVPIAYLFNGSWPVASRPFEVEAEFLEVR